MPLNLSDGLATALVGPVAFDDVFRDGAILVYGGAAQPATASSPRVGTLLARITNGGGAWTHGSPTNGLRFVRAGRFVIPDPAQDWRIRGIANGTARWFRLVANPFDGGEASLSLPRVDGTVYALDDPRVGLVLPTTTISNTLDRLVDGFQFTL